MLLALAVGAPAAWADAFLDQAKATVKTATEKSGTWDGPTSGPAGMPGKTVVYRRRRPAQRRPHRRRQWCRRGGQGPGLDHARHRRPGHRRRRLLGDEPGDRAEAGRDHRRRLRPRAEHVERRGRGQAGHQDGRPGTADPTPGPVAGTPVFFNVTTDPEKVARGVGDVRDRRLRRQGRRGRVHRQRLRDRDQEIRRDGGDDQEMRRAAPCSRSRTRRSPTSPTACRS